MMGHWILYRGWCWLFWTITILSALNLGLFILLTKETYAPCVFLTLYPCGMTSYQDNREGPRLPRPDIRSSRPPRSPQSSHPSVSSTISAGWVSWSPPTMLDMSSAEPSLDHRDYCLGIRWLSLSWLTMLIYGRHRLHKASFVELMESLAIIYVFLVSVPLLFGSPPFSRSGLFSYEWPQSTLSLAYVGMGELRPYRA